MSSCNIFDVLPHPGLFLWRQGRAGERLFDARPVSLQLPSAPLATGSLQGSLYSEYPHIRPGRAGLQLSSYDPRSPVSETKVASAQAAAQRRNDAEWSDIRRRLWNAKQPAPV